MKQCKHCDNTSAKGRTICQPCRNKQVAAKRLGISFEEALSWYNRTNNCDVCNIVLDIDKQLDHCHETGEVRGVLCRKCNMALGLVDDNKEILLNMIHYLNTNKWEENHISYTEHRET